LFSDWLPALAAAPAEAQQHRTSSTESRFRSIALARWRHAGVTSCFKRQKLFFFKAETLSFARMSFCERP
jgi:hypothetical protein